MSNVKTYLVQIKQLLEKIDDLTGSSKIYDFLKSLDFSGRDELWEPCNTINSLNTICPIGLLQKQIESTDQKGYNERYSIQALPSGVEIIKGEARFLSEEEQALKFARGNVTKLLKINQHSSSL